MLSLLLLFTCVQLLVAAANGVVIATEKKLPSILVDETSVSDFVFFPHVYRMHVVGAEKTML